MTIDFPAFRYLSEGRFWVRIWREVNDDDCWGMAAQLSYYFLLAFVPFLIFLSALIGFIPYLPDLIGLMLVDFSNFLPEASVQLVTRVIERVIYSRAQGALTFGLVAALWFASSAFNGMISLLNKAYQVRETRSYFETRLVAILVTVVFSIFLIVAGVLLFFGDWAIDTLVKNMLWNTLYTSSRWLLILLFLNFGVQIVYHFLPAHRFPWTLLSPGGFLATTGWVVGSALFRFWVNRFADLQILWGSLSALIALLAWFYISSFFLLLGGEIDSEIHKIRGETAEAPGETPGPAADSTLPSSSAQASR